MDREPLSARARTLLRRMPAVGRSAQRWKGHQKRQEHHPRRLNRQRRQIEALRQRVDEVEEELQECRRLNKRVAEVTDIVAEVLMPAAHRDDGELRRRLERYAETL